MLVFDIIAGIEDATKTIPTIKSSNALYFDCCDILMKSKNKSETNISEKVCRDIINGSTTMIFAYQKQIREEDVHYQQKTSTRNGGTRVE